jgi:hypothetical protein
MIELCDKSSFHVDASTSINISTNINQYINIKIIMDKTRPTKVDTIGGPSVLSTFSSLATGNFFILSNPFSSEHNVPKVQLCYCSINTFNLN